MNQPLYDAGTLLDYDSRTDRYFYVTIQRGHRQGFLLGPYDTHDVALAAVDRGRALACKADVWAEFDAFGTASVCKECKIKTVFGL
jgi:hypothetical protein